MCLQSTVVTLMECLLYPAQICKSIGCPFCQKICRKTHILTISGICILLGFISPKFGVIFCQKWNRLKFWYAVGYGPLLGFHIPKIWSYAHISRKTQILTIFGIWTIINFKYPHLDMPLLMISNEPIIYVYCINTDGNWYMHCMYVRYTGSFLFFKYLINLLHDLLEQAMVFY